MQIAKQWIPDPVERLNLVLCAGAIVTSAAFLPPRFAASVAAGVVFEWLNFRALRRAGRRLFAGELGGAGSWTALFGLRMAILGGAMYAALDLGANPIGLVLGLSLIVPATLWVSWRSEVVAPVGGDWEVPPPEDPSWDNWNPWLAREREADEDVPRAGRTAAGEPSK